VELIFVFKSMSVAIAADHTLFKWGWVIDRGMATIIAEPQRVGDLSFLWDGSDPSTRAGGDAMLDEKRSRAVCETPITERHRRHQEGEARKEVV